jgi:gliding motility-associated-like protein
MVTATITATCGTYTDTFYKNIINCLPPGSCTGVILYADSCFNKPSNFQITSIYPINAVQWNFGDPASGINNSSISLSPAHAFSSIGTFTVSAIVNFSCGIDTIENVISIFSCDTDNGSTCTLYIPNAFSPNNDNTNDFFFPIKNAACSLTEYTLFIYNRWGERIYESDNINDKWNGQYRNQNCPTGVYYYYLSYKFNNQIKQTRKGDITILR